MSTGSSPAYFHRLELGESRVAHDPLRDRLGRPTSLWTVPQGASAHRVTETERFGCGGCEDGPVKNLTSPSVVQTSQLMPPLGMHLHATTSVPFPGRTGHAPQVRHPTEAAARPLNGSPSGWNAFSGSPDIGNADASGPGIAEASALCFTDRVWDDLVKTPFVSGPRLHPLNLRVRPWDGSKPTRVQPPSLIRNNATSPEPMPPHHADDDQDAHTFLCEWTEENSTCNMEILGDRVWMSHHLSRQHNVVGHERSQRACLWRGCTDTMNKGSLARHIVSRHLRAGAACGFCSKVYSRADVARRHTKKCKVANGALGQHDQAT